LAEPRRVGQRPALFNIARTPPDHFRYDAWDVREFMGLQSGMKRPRHDLRFINVPWPRAAHCLENRIH